MSTLTTPAIGRNPLIRNPHALRQLSALPEHIDGNAAAWVPISADAKPLRFDRSRDPFADGNRAVLVESAMVTETRDIEFEGFRFQKPLARHIVDHKMREIRLSGHRAKCGKFRHDEPHHVIGVGLRIGHAVKLRKLGAGWPSDGPAKLQG